MRVMAGRFGLQDRFQVLDRRAQLMSAKQLLIFLIYLVPFTAFFVIALHLLHRNFSTLAAGRAALYLTNILARRSLHRAAGPAIRHAVSIGKIVHPLPDPGFVPLSTIVAIQFVPLLAIAAIVATSPGGAPDRACPGALICGLFRDLVRGGGHRHAGGVLNQKMG